MKVIKGSGLRKLRNLRDWIPPAAGLRKLVRRAAIADSGDVQEASRWQLLDTAVDAERRWDATELQVGSKGTGIQCRSICAWEGPQSGEV